MRLKNRIEDEFPDMSKDYVDPEALPAGNEKDEVQVHVCVYNLANHNHVHTEQ